jgi:uncharacterized protein (DUF1501 family)
LIIARNAVRAKNGTVFINVSSGGWDTHVGMFDMGMGGNFYQLATEFDRAVGALVEDLRASGDLASTLVVMMGEFGRTPANLNSRGGRDHYREVMCCGLIGGGVKGGRTLGVSSADGSRVIEPGWSANRAIRTEDNMCTIYSALGIDYTSSIADTPSGRRYSYIPGAADGVYQPVEEVFG